jgi:hypothetical protein
MAALPDELWECIFKFLGHRDHHKLKSLCVVSKKFLSITNSLRLSLNVTNQTIPFLSRLFQRFPNLTSLNLIINCESESKWLKANITKIFNFPLDIKSLYLSNYSGNLEGMQPLSKYIIRSVMCYIDKNDLVLATASDPSRNELQLSFPMISVNFILISMAY